MLGSTEGTTVNRVLLGVSLLLTLCLPTNAEQLPIKTYTTADGLVNNRISRIVRDSRGYLWFCTEDGLSCFDGYTFTNYTTQDGLPDSYVDDLLERRDGTYWIATAKGLCRFNPTGSPVPMSQRSRQNVQPLFEVYRPDAEDSAAIVKVLCEDHSGTLWCGTRHGVYRVEETNDRVELRYVDFGIARDERGGQYIRGIVEDRQGVLWVSSRSGLYRRFPNGRCEAFTTANGLGSNDLGRLMVNPDGEIWVPSQGFALRIATDVDANQSIVAERYGTSDGLPCGH